MAVVFGTIMYYDRVTQATPHIMLLCLSKITANVFLRYVGTADAQALEPQHPLLDYGFLGGAPDVI